MSKKQFLELLIRLHGLEPDDIRHYRTDGFGGQYPVGIGWEGGGINPSGEQGISFAAPDGFEWACYHILEEGRRLDIKLKHPA